MSVDALVGVPTMTSGSTDVFEAGVDRNESPPAVKQKESYEEIMGISAEDMEEDGGNKALSTRLIAFREWLEQKAKVTVHPHLCVVNGEATDGTKNAPVLIYGPPSGISLPNQNPAEGRIGMIDGEGDRALYDRRMGCEIRAVKEIKKDDVLITVPSSAMITPDLVASSDAGRAVLACCEPANANGVHFWDAFENTTICQNKFMEKIGNNGTQLLVKILQERKQAEVAETKSLQALDQALQSSDGFAAAGKRKANLDYRLVPRGTISTRAPILAFLIHQRFSAGLHPEVISSGAEVDEELEDSHNGVSTARRIHSPPSAPSSFGPYARTMPSAVALPLCWKRIELGLLSGCVPGLLPLQEVTAMTLHLSSEYVALVEAGILHRFPSVFPRGLITWERWVWAASVFASRVLPASSAVIASNKNGSSSFVFQSDPDIWNELGVMIPFLDMMNHESDSAQVIWQPPSIGGAEGGVDAITDTNPKDFLAPRAICYKRVKKGSQLYVNYGLKNNYYFLSQYGFALINNPSDFVKMSWGLADAVGGTKPPNDYMPPAEKSLKTRASDVGEDDGASKENPKNMAKFFGNVHESTDPSEINKWWSDSRLSLLEHAALLPETHLSLLKSGRKMVIRASNDGVYDPYLLSASLVATIDSARADFSAIKKDQEDIHESEAALLVTRSHLDALRNYLLFYFTRKIEKLLQNLNNGLTGKIDDVKLWTKMTEGGLSHSSENSPVEGWNRFFERKAYITSAEVEKHYYALAPESCVLALYDGQIRALKASIDGLIDQEKFDTGLVSQLEDIGFKIVPDSELLDDDLSATDDVAGKEDESTQKIGEDSNGKAKEKVRSKRNRRNRKRGSGPSSNGPGNDRPAAIKLHIGNLAYCTLASDLFEYFASTYGRENVLECHIPTERDSGRSRGFGFVTMVEAASLKTLQQGKKHEVHGRLLKIAESNSAGSASRNRGPGINAIVASDRCARCGYRPRYCVCAVPDIPAFNGGSGRSYSDDFYGRGDPEHDYYGGSYRRERGGDSYSPSPGRHRSDSRSRRDREYDRFDRDHGRSRRSWSRSYSRERDRDRDRDRDKSRRRSRDRDRELTRSREHRRYEDRSRSRHSRSRSVESDISRSPSPTRNRDRDEEHRFIEDKNSELRASKEVDGKIGQSPSTNSAGGEARRRERESRKRSRSRSRGKTGKRKRSSRKESRKHTRDRSPRDREKSPRDRSPRDTGSPREESPGVAEA